MLPLASRPAIRGTGRDTCPSLLQTTILSQLILEPNKVYNSRLYLVPYLSYKHSITLRKHIVFGSVWTPLALAKLNYDDPADYTTHPTKTQVMWLRSGQVDIIDIPVLSSEVKVVESTRDLGVVKSLTASCH